jgi:hypothetical protein
VEPVSGWATFLGAGFWEMMTIRYYYYTGHFMPEIRDA